VISQNPLHRLNKSKFIVVIPRYIRMREPNEPESTKKR